MALRGELRWNELDELAVNKVYFFMVPLFGNSSIFCKN